MCSSVPDTRNSETLDFREVENRSARSMEDAKEKNQPSLKPREEDRTC